MKTKIKNNFCSKTVFLKYSNSKIFKFLIVLSLSWIYAICSQIIIPLPFNFVPISLQPLPLFVFSLLLGWPAVWAYFLCLFQTALGAPFFSGFQVDLIKIFLGTIFVVKYNSYKK